VPFICQFIAMRWSYEELVVAQAKLNPLTRRQETANNQLQRLAPRAHDAASNKWLEDLKEALAVLSGLEGKSAGDVDRYLKLIDPILERKKPFERSAFKDAIGPVTAEQLYVNQKVSDLISNAEMEQSDYRRGFHPNVFFCAEKRYFGIRGNVFVWNTFVLIGSTLGLLGLLHWILRRQLEVRRT
jgi:ABC transport system ATP-binding/permease protein